MQAQDKGGAICNEGKLILSNCIFDTNTAGSFGGAICMFAGSAEISNSDFANNILTNFAFTRDTYECFGGAIGIYEGKVVVTGCNFAQNNAHQGITADGKAINGCGGAIGVYNGRLEVNGVKFEENNAGCGGAIAVRTGTLTVNNFEVKNNTAANAGGGLYLKGGNVEILDGTIQNNATTLEGKAEDVEWLISDSASTYLTNNVFSASVSNTEKNSIYSASEFPVGANFALGGKAELTLAPDKTVYVKENLTTTAPITLSASRSNGEDMVGMRVVYFASDDAVTEKVFKMSTLEHNLVLGSEAGEKFLYITTEYLVQFYQYYENEEFKNPLTAKGQNHEQRITYGNAATEPDYGTREGMVFGGWEARLMEDPTQVVNVSPSRITNNVYFVAKWGVVAQVTFTADGVPVGKPLEIITGTAITQAQLEAYAIPAKTGHTPKHWAIEVDGQLVEYTNQKITGNTTLTAVYEPDILTVTLKDENNITLGTVEVEYNNKLTADDILYINEFLDFDRVGYDDDDPYWSLNGTAFNFNTAITSNITLIATYVKNQYRVDFVVEYYTLDGVYQTDYTLNASSVGYGDVVSEFPTPKTVEGFDPTKVVWDYDNSAITENTTITGRIDINVYTVNFIVDGEVIATYQKEHFQTLDSSEIPAPIPSKVGYDQRDPIWKGDLSAEIKSDINFEAEYFLNVYYVTFILPDGTKLEPREVYHGHTVDSSNVIDLAFGEIVQFNKSLDNITEDCEISVTKINLFMWIMIAVGIIILIIAIIVTVKVVKRKRMVKEARKRHRHIGPYVTGDDEF